MEFLAGAMVLVWLAVIALHDLRSRTIPNALVAPGLIAAVVSAAASGQVALAALVAAVPYLVAWALHQCGGGDVKLALVVGALTAHWSSALLVVVGAAALSAVTMTVISLAGRPDNAAGTAQPHGPALALVCGVMIWP